MALRAGALGASEEIFLNDSGISLCLLVNRRARSMRIVDFRSGPSPRKRIAVAAFARKEGIERVYTLVERDECSTWARMGFTKEGTIPYFYKRSDAHVLGALVSPEVGEEDDSERSGTRLALGAGGADVLTERLYQAVRRNAKARQELPRMAVKVQPAKDADVTKAVAAAVRSGRALTGFERFGRDSDRSYFVCTARGGLSLQASVELQPCFDHAFLELLTSPRTEKEGALAQAAVQRILDDLVSRNVVGCFTLSPVEDTDLGGIYVALGFRKTAVLRRHAVSAERRVDVFLWSRKLANPSDT
jgi:hypothetical protein